MRLGIFGRTFPGTDPEAVLDRVAGAGFATVHWNMDSAGLEPMPDRVPEGLPDRVAAAARERGLAIAGVSGTFNMIHPDPVERSRGLERLGILLPAARAMGASLVSLCTGTRDPTDPWRGHPDNATPEAWTDLLSQLEAALPLAEAARVRLGIEPETANVVGTPEQARRLLDLMRSPALAVILDLANLFEEPPAPADLREGVVRAVDVLADRLAMVHAKDRDASGRVVAAGQGIIDFDHFAGCLRQAGFQGDVVTHGLSPIEAPEVARFLSGLFG